MMQKWIVMQSCILIASLSLTSPALAESQQWVLWQNVLDERGKQPPEPIDTFSSQDACQAKGRAQIVHLATYLRKTYTVAVGDTGMVVIYAYPTNEPRCADCDKFFYSYRCWPVGVTPR